MRNLTCLALLATAACFPRGWPSPPPDYQGEVPSPVDGDAEILAQLHARADASEKYPDKYYWYDAPSWKDVTSELGIVTGRKTGNSPVVELTRLDGSPDGWEDMCVLRKISVEQELSGDAFVAAKPSAALGRHRVDCSVYEQAPGG